tara:strand:+ start:7747 stop:8205 length:459 start_codon:yes stop_codon:yes gene_type:complete
MSLRNKLEEATDILTTFSDQEKDNNIKLGQNKNTEFDKAVSETRGEQEDKFKKQDEKHLRDEEARDADANKAADARVKELTDGFSDDGAVNTFVEAAEASEEEQKESLQLIDEKKKEHDGRLAEIKSSFIGEEVEPIEAPDVPVGGVVTPVG